MTTQVVASGNEPTVVLVIIQHGFEFANVQADSDDDVARFIVGPLQDGHPDFRIIFRAVGWAPCPSSSRSNFLSWQTQ